MPEPGYAGGDSISVEVESRETGWSRRVGSERGGMVGLYSDMWVLRSVSLLKLGVTQAVRGLGSSIGLASSKDGRDAVRLI